MKVLNILIANNHLVKTGGTENYTYALALSLKKQGHNVEYFCFQKGEISNRLEENGVQYMSKPFYDLILANHIPVVSFLYRKGIIVQTCHGKLTPLEQPNKYADFHVAISKEIKDHLNNNGYSCTVINNGIDCSRFFPFEPISATLRTVLSLCQSEKANRFIKDCCDELKLNFMSLNKHTDNVWNVEEYINKADLVVGIGRSIYDSLACGRCVISFDYRDYMDHPMGSGYLCKDNFEISHYYNCIGREKPNHSLSKNDFILELKKYNLDDGKWARDLALREFNIDIISRQYLNYYSPVRSLYKYVKLLPIRMVSFIKRVI